MILKFQKWVYKGMRLFFCLKLKRLSERAAKHTTETRSFSQKNSFRLLLLGDLQAKTILYFLFLIVISAQIMISVFWVSKKVNLLANIPSRVQAIFSFPEEGPSEKVRTGNQEYKIILLHIFYIFFDKILRDTYDFNCKYVSFNARLNLLQIIWDIWKLRYSRINKTHAFLVKQVLWYQRTLYDRHFFYSFIYAKQRYNCTGLDIL